MKTGMAGCFEYYDHFQSLEHCFDDRFYAVVSGVSYEEGSHLELDEYLTYPFPMLAFPAHTWTVSACQLSVAATDHENKKEELERGGSCQHHWAPLSRRHRRGYRPRS